MKVPHAVVVCVVFEFCVSWGQILFCRHGMNVLTTQRRNAGMKIKYSAGLAMEFIDDMRTLIWKQQKQDSVPLTLQGNTDHAPPPPCHDRSDLAMWRGWEGEREVLVTLRAHLHQASESVCINSAVMLVSHWPLWSHLRMGLQSILEQLHCGQWELCHKRYGSVDANGLWHLV